MVDAFNTIGYYQGADLQHVRRDFPQPPRLKVQDML